MEEASKEIREILLAGFKSTKLIAKYKNVQEFTEALKD